MPIIPDVLTPVRICPSTPPFWAISIYRSISRKKHSPPLGTGVRGWAGRLGWLAGLAGWLGWAGWAGWLG